MCKTIIYSSSVKEILRARITEDEVVGHTKYISYSFHSSCVSGY